MHRVREHVGELAIELWAADLPELYAEAARAFAEIVGGAELREAADDSPAEAATPRRVTLTARDRDALLVRWLNELVFLYEHEGLVYPDVHVLAADDQGLAAELVGRRVDHPSVAVKAATFHGLRVAPADHGLRATVILDV